MVVAAQDRRGRAEAIGKGFTKVIEIILQKIMAAVGVSRVGEEAAHERRKAFNFSALCP